MHRLATALMLSLCMSVAQAATLSSYASVATWQAATSGTVLSEDFSAYALGTPMSGVSFLPGVSVSSNMGPLTVFSAGDHRLFAAATGSREGGNGYYQIDYAIGYRAVAFEIDAFEANPDNPSMGQGPGLLEIGFADGSTQFLQVFGNPAGDTIFIGLSSDSAFTSIRWWEALEASGGNEESSLDMFRVANRVPEPNSLVLMLPALGLLMRRARRAD